MRGSHQVLKLSEHGMKALEIRLKEKPSHDGMPFGFISKKGTINARFAVIIRYI